MRGENGVNRSVDASMIGTSPRARGKHAMIFNQQISIRNIPACAGKTWLPRNTRMRPMEHPRVRGENRAQRRQECRVEGTSPRVRGKLRSSENSTVANRNIPACAGKTFRGKQPPAPEKEHPRVRGENATTFKSCKYSFGTSPRARGKPLFVLSVVFVLRNIPACAGKTNDCGDRN